MKILFSVLSLALTLSLHAGEKLAIRGSETLGAKLVPRLAEAYRASGKTVKFSIAAEGSSTAFPALLDHKADIGMSSRKITDGERAVFHQKGADVKETVLCMDGIAVLVNAANPVKGLTKAQVRDILGGQIKDWSAVGGKAGAITVFGRNAASGTYSESRRLAMALRPFASNARKMVGNEQITGHVAKDPNGIGYVSVTFSHQAGTKMLPIDGMLPGERNVRSQKYPYSRQTYLYTARDASTTAKDFVAFCASPAGVRVIREAGFIPTR